eukprot:COSAG02_NODE_6020_length_3870_cov_25.718377_4_plen_436_part_00
MCDEERARVVLAATRVSHALRLHTARPRNARSATHPRASDPVSGRLIARTSVSKLCVGLEAVQQMERPGSPTPSEQLSLVAEPPELVHRPDPEDPLAAVQTTDGGREDPLAAVQTTDSCPEDPLAAVRTTDGDLEECAICLGTLDDPQPFPNPDCPHQFCSSCLSKLHRHLEGSPVPCPTCRRQSSQAISTRQIRTFEQRRLDPEERRNNQRMVTGIGVGALVVACTCGLVVDYLIRVVSATEVRSAVARLVPLLPGTAPFARVRRSLLVSSAPNGGCGDSQFAESYTISGCADPAHCGEYVKIDPEVFCSGAPAYKLNSTDGQTRVLYRITTGIINTLPTTAWYVPTPGQGSSEGYLETCEHQVLGDLLSVESVALGGPDSHVYQHWRERVGNRWAAPEPGKIVVVGDFADGSNPCPSTGCGDRHNMGAAGGGR